VALCSSSTTKTAKDAISSKQRESDGGATEHQESWQHNTEAQMNEHDLENARASKNAQWHFLKCLCAPNLPPHLRQEFCAKVPAATFTDLANQIVFEEICALSKPPTPRPAADVHEHLPTRVTARGFPDLDFADLLSAPQPPHKDAHTHLQHAYQLLIDVK
jgi:hypothetical protein